MVRKITCLFVLVLITHFILAQSNDGINYPLIGKVKPKHAEEIVSNNWSIGAETMDRDLLEFESFREYLGPLGAKKVRLQAGWAKCEKVKGQYDFEWLDEIIDGVIDQGVEPWLQTSYGNPIYPGGGGIHLGAGFPSSEEALNAWDNWVRAMVKRYKDKVKYWEIWNEPDGKDKNDPEDYSKLYVRTAEIIKAEIPEATLFALSLANLGKKGEKWVHNMLSYLKDCDKLYLVDEITLHGYRYNPSDVYPRYEKIHNIIKQYSNDIKIRQGELGCPSEFQTIYALRNHSWTEVSQSKWLLRKLMGDLGRDIPSSYFLIIDVVYTHNHEELMEQPKRNTKGLIKSDLNKNFVALKESYFAYQHVTSIFDNSLVRIPNYPYTSNADSSIAVFGYRLKHFDNQIVCVWEDGQIPGDSNAKREVTFDFSDGKIKDPVYVDLRTGNVYKIPESDFIRNGTNHSFKNVPVYDSPVLIADKSLIPLKE